MQFDIGVTQLNLKLKVLGFLLEDGWATRHRIKSGSPFTKALAEGIVVWLLNLVPKKQLCQGASIPSLCLADHESALTSHPRLVNQVMCVLVKGQTTPTVECPLPPI